MLHNSAFGTKFRFEFDGDNYREINDSIIGCNLPGISLGTVDRKVAGKTAFYPGTSITISDLMLTIKADDNYSTWIKILQWIIDNYDGSRLFSSGSLYMLSPKDEPIFSLSLYNMFPNDVSEIQYTRTDGQPDILTFTSTFKINGISYNSSF